MSTQQTVNVNGTSILCDRIVAEPWGGFHEFASEETKAIGSWTRLWFYLGERIVHTEAAPVEVCAEVRS